jgi:myo-inositol-1(or 4)-monophosphatase
MEGDRPLPEWESTVRALLVSAGHASMAHFRSVEVETKADSTPVTIADRAAEAVLVQGLRTLFPRDAIVSEEGASAQGVSGRTWYVDPIDGTAAFIEGLSHWGPVVGCMDEHGPCVGAAYMPRTGDFFFATRGGGAWLDGERLSALKAPLGGRGEVIYVPSRFHQYVEFNFEGKSRHICP